MYKAAVIGDYDSIYGFAALGLDTFPIASPEEAAATLRRIAGGSHAVIYITEALAAALGEELDLQKPLQPPWARSWTLTAPSSSRPSS